MLGWFDKSLAADAWFDKALIPVGWFDKALILDAAAAAALPGGGEDDDLYWLRPPSPLAYGSRWVDLEASLDDELIVPPPPAFVPDEDYGPYWLPRPVIPPVPVQIVFDVVNDDDTIERIQSEEDYRVDWTPQVVPPAVPPRFFTDDDVIERLKAEEDYHVAVWIPPPVIPVPPRFFTDDDLPAGSLFGQPDEDFNWAILWGPRPVLWSPPLQAITDDDLPAGSLVFANPDEDYNVLAWTGPEPIQWLPPLQALTDDDLTFFFTPTWNDEDFTVTWIVPPVVYTSTRVFADDDLPAGSLLSFGQQDEDFDWRLIWGQPVLVYGSNQVFADDDVIELIQVDEQYQPFWLPAPVIPPVPVQALINAASDDEVLPHIRAEEDYDWFLWNRQYDGRPSINVLLAVILGDGENSVAFPPPPPLFVDEDFTVTWIVPAVVWGTGGGWNGQRVPALLFYGLLSDDDIFVPFVPPPEGAPGYVTQFRDTRRR